MKNILYTLLLTGTILVASSAFPLGANANCQPVYGGGQTCTSNSFYVQKFVQIPGKSGGDYVNNLFADNAKYSPSQTASFKVIVTNTGSETISSINVVDSLPEFVSFVSGPGNYDANKRTLSFTVNNLGAGQSSEYFINVKINDANALPSDQGIICKTNQVQAKDGTGVTSDASSQFCIQKSVLPAVAPAPKIVSTPATGAGVLPLLALIPGALGGLILRKKSVKTVFKGGEK